MAVIAGKRGAVAVGGFQEPFRNWKLGMKVGTNKTHNFVTTNADLLANSPTANQPGANQGFFAARRLLTNISEAQITAEMPYDQGNVALVLGLTYTVVLYFDLINNLQVTVPAILVDMVPAVNVENEEVMEATFEQTGMFDYKLL